MLTFWTLWTLGGNEGREGDTVQVSTAMTLNDYIDKVYGIADDWYLNIPFDLGDDWATLHRNLRRLYGHWACRLSAREKWQAAYDLPTEDGYRGNGFPSHPLQSLAGTISAVKRRRDECNPYDSCPVDRWVEGIALRIARRGQDNGIWKVGWA